MNGLQNKVLLDPKLDIASIGFDRMLNDRKNVDLKDRLYFTMGLLEEGKGNFKEALSLLSKSVQLGKMNTTQIPYTYLELARIHYDKLDDYTTAKLYYDSALVALPREIPLFKETNERKSALDTFVKHFETVRTEDSLQILAALSPEVLTQRIDKIIEKEVADKKLREEEEKKKLAQQQAMATSNPTTSVAGGNQLQRWELYDPAKANAGKSAFQRAWGNRPLEDDWRRSQKELRSNSNLAGISSDSLGTAQEVASKQEEMVPGSIQWTARQTALRATVPTTPETLQQSHKRKEDALFELGKIYYLALAEPQKSRVTFDRLLKEYPQTSYREEIYYLSYLASEEGQRDVWKNRLVDEFPGSTYVSLLGDGSTASLDKIASMYEQVYGLYRQGNFEQGLQEVEAMMPKVRQSQLEPKFALLRIFLIGNVRGEAAYKSAIQEFLKLYPSSEYVSRVQEMAAMPRLR
jgi:tetratricopeptide (TPR) repeat protein